MLLRLFNDSTPLVNTTGKRNAATAVESATPTEPEPMANGDDDDIDNEDGGVLLEPTGDVEEEAIKKENLALGQLEDEVMKARQSFVSAKEEDDVMNTTV